MLRSILLAGVAAVLAAPVASAQTTNPASETSDPSTVGEVIVTGSRITANGFQQPTPVTVVGEQEIARQMPVTIAQYLNTLPSFGGATSARNPGIGVASGGTETLNLRNLGTTRTLVLLDNRRTVEAAAGGGVDTVTLPSGLFKRVEVVTGGASAAWGSDAVAGVVNFVLNTDYDGLGVNLEGGVTERGDNLYGKTNITAGRKFADGRGRVIAEFDYSKSGNGADLSDRGWFDSRAVVNNPAYTATNGQVRQVTIKGAAPANMSPGGVITAGPLRGIQFVGPTGTPVPYNFGTQSGSVQYGGDTDNSVGEARAISVELEYANAFTHVEYDLTPDITAYAEGSYARSWYTENGYLYFYRQGNLVINADNAYLDPSIKAQMAARGLTTFNMGLDTVEHGPPTSTNEREVWRTAVGLDGKFGESWKWHAYYTHGEVNSKIRALNNAIVPRFLLAVDAVRNPATGAIVCRSTLTAPTNGCVPLNVFGNGVATAEALKYTRGVAMQDANVQLDVVSADASGTIFTLPAGDVSVAVGADYIKNKASATQDDLALNRQFAVQNFQPFSGERSVKEAFAEINVPLLKDLPLVQRLEVNGAARLTDYSTSGSVTTWKGGVSYQATSDLRLRATLSHDIRAPSLSDLFSGGTFTQQSVFDPITNKTYPQLTNARGNPDLKPEEADTTTAGVIYSPSFVPGLQLSIDYYKIDIKGAIASVSAPLTLQFCAAGRTEFCPFIIRDSTQAITSIITVPVNVASQLTEGWDYEVDYKRAVGPGSVTLRGLASYVPKFRQIDASGTLTNYAGQVGDLNPGQPKWKANVSATYEQGPASARLSARYIGKAKLQNAWREGVDVDDNSVPDHVTVDLTAVYKFEMREIPYELTFGIDNLLDRDPVQIPVIPGTVQYGTAPGTGGRFDLYDPLGRRYRLGLRAKF